MWIYASNHWGMPCTLGQSQLKLRGLSVTDMLPMLTTVACFTCCQVPLLCQLMSLANVDVDPRAQCHSGAMACIRNATLLHQKCNLLQQKCKLFASDGLDTPRAALPECNILVARWSQ